MKEEKQYKILPNGKCQLGNPFEKPTESSYYQRKSEGVSWGDYHYKQWVDFDKSNPPLDYIQPQRNNNQRWTQACLWNWMGRALAMIHYPHAHSAPIQGIRRRPIIGSAIVLIISVGLTIFCYLMCKQ